MSGPTGRNTRNSRSKRFLPLETFGLALHTPKRPRSTRPKKAGMTLSGRDSSLNDPKLPPVSDISLSSGKNAERIDKMEAAHASVDTKVLVEDKSSKLVFGFDETLPIAKSPLSPSTIQANEPNTIREIELNGSPLLEKSVKAPHNETVNTISQSSEFHSPTGLPKTTDLSMDLRPSNETEIKKILIHPKDRGDTGAISDALNQMYILMQENKISFDEYISQNEERFLKIDENLGELSGRIDSLEHEVHEHDNSITGLKKEKASLSDLNLLREEMAGLKTSCFSALKEAKEVSACQADLIDRQESEIASLRLQQSRANYQQSILSERINVHDIRSKHLSITIDGLPEAPEKGVITSIIDRIHADTEVQLSKDDFLLAYRVGQPRVSKNEGSNEGEEPQGGENKRPRQIKAKIANDKIRDQLMASKGKLKKNADKTSVWINESLPETYKRRKIMLRELVKFINKKPNDKAAIESGSLRLNDQFIEPNHLNDLPDEYHPRNVQILEVEDEGLAFVGEWAYLSNMYRCPVFYNDLEFTSSEQAFQFMKADYHGNVSNAKKILHLEDPFEIKKVGGSIQDKQEWLDCRDGILEEIIREKFFQNPDIRERLVATDEKPIYEATLGSHWGINAGLRSKVTRTCAGNGENIVGGILMRIRSEFATETTETTDIPTGSTAS